MSSSGSSSPSSRPHGSVEAGKGETKAPKIMVTADLDILTRDLKLLKSGMK